MYSNSNEAAVKNIVEPCAVSGHKAQYSTYMDSRGDRLLQHTVVIQEKQRIQLKLC